VAEVPRAAPPGSIGRRGVPTVDPRIVDDERTRSRAIAGLGGVPFREREPPTPPRRRIGRVQRKGPLSRPFVFVA